METKPFPYPPFDEIPSRCMPETFLNNHPQAMTREAILSKIQHKMGRSESSPDFLNPQKIGSSPQFLVRPESIQPPHGPLLSRHR